MKYYQTLSSLTGIKRIRDNYEYSLYLFDIELPTGSTGTNEPVVKLYVVEYGVVKHNTADKK